MSPPSFGGRSLEDWLKVKKTATEIRSHLRVRGVQYGTIKAGVETSGGYHQQTAKYHCVRN